MKKVNGYLASIVTLRNALNHPVDSAKWTLAVRTFLQYSKDEERYDSVPLNIKKYCVMLKQVDIGSFVNYVAGLFDSADKANQHAMVFLDIKVPRGRKHKFDSGVIVKCRLLAPEIYKNLPEDKFCVVMKDTLLNIEKEVHN